MGRSVRWWSAGVFAAASVAVGGVGPVVGSWPVEGGDDTAAVAAAALSGWYATGDSFEDTVEIRDIRGSLVRSISRAEIEALLPWMSLDGGPDGPSGLAWSDSGRLLFILCHDANPAGDGLGSDAVLRYDTGTGSLAVFARLELFDRGDEWPHLAAAHFRGRLYVGGADGGVRVYQAGANNVTGGLIATVALPSGGPVRGLAVDRGARVLYAASDSSLYRASLASWPIVFSHVGDLAEVRALAFSDHYGGPGNAGLYVLCGSAAAHQVYFLTPEQAQGQAAFAPMPYLSGAGEWHDLAATADGTLLAGADEDAALISDSTDARLPFEGWLADEFSRVVAFAKGLISPDGEPEGWVIDGDVIPGWSRFHPATPDGAAWVVLALLMNDHLNGDPEAQGMVRVILRRYAGLAPDGIGPTRTVDGIYRHWIDPLTGGAKSGWSTEFATLSTMKIALAASRARAFYPGDPEIRAAADAILCGVKNHDAYINAANDGIYMVAHPLGGPVAGSLTLPFNEAILFAEQAAAYGGAVSEATYSRWLERWRWPTATYIAGRSVTGDVAGQFQAAFVSLYPLLLQEDFRSSTAWAEHVANLRASFEAWTDDNGPRFNTVFSAGTTRSDWGGYNADSLSNHPGDVATFPSLMAFCADGRTAPAVGAYNAYRRGARQAFASGASILYRRSEVDPGYVPNSAGLPDVVLGALGLAELMAPGSVGAVLARPYGPCGCAADCDGNGSLTVADFSCFRAAYLAEDASADFDGDGELTVADFSAFRGAYLAGCE